MTTWLLIPGAGGAGWYWHRVAERLRAAGHDPVVVELPSEDPEAGIQTYADVAIAALDGRADPVVVGQSLGGFPATAVCLRIPAQRLVLVNAMIPAVGETAGQWWSASGFEEARAAAARAAGREHLDFDEAWEFLHDVPAELVAEGERHERGQSDGPFRDGWALRSWPAVPTTVIVGRDDRFFPADFQTRLARERAGVEPIVLPGGHLIALANPDGLVEDGLGVGTSSGASSRER